MNYIVVFIVVENSILLFFLVVGLSLNNESNFFKIKFIVERNNVFYGLCILCFFFGFYFVVYIWFCISCFVLERLFLFLFKE